MTGVKFVAALGVIFFVRKRKLKLMLRAVTLALMLVPALACSTYPCSQDASEDSMTGQVSVGGASWDVPKASSGRFQFSNYYEDMHNVLVFSLSTPDGYILTSFRRPATTGTFRFEDLAIQQWLCPPDATYTQYTGTGGDPPTCSGEAGVVPSTPLAFTGTVEMTDDTFVSSDSWNLTATLRLTNASPAITLDVNAHIKHGTIQQTCAHDALLPPTQ